MILGSAGIPAFEANSDRISLREKLQAGARAQIAKCALGEMDFVHLLLEHVVQARRSSLMVPLRAVVSSLL